MHISSYILSHMLYQALLCLAQTGVTLYVTLTVGVKYPQAGLVTPFFMIDFGLSMFLITYASDMLSLWVSTLARTTTTAMTIMPFVLIFQLVFSGGMLTLPAWTEPLTHFTISNPGLKVIAAQADTNNRPFVTISDMIGKMRNSEVGGTVTVGQVMDLLTDADNPTIQELRSMELGGVMTLGEVKQLLESSSTFEALKDEAVVSDMTVEGVLQIIMGTEEFQEVSDTDFGLPGFTLGKLLEDIFKSEAAKPLLKKQITTMATVGDVLTAVDASGLMEKYGDTQIGGTFTLGEVIDQMAGNDDVQARRNEEITVKTTLGKLLDIVGEDKIKAFLEEKAAATSYNAAYDCTAENVVDYWTHLLLFILAFAALATITLEFIDKDKR